MVDFFNHHKNEFKLSRELTSQDNDAITQKFENTYRTVTATKENPHMDDFMFLDTDAQGEHDIFITHKGLICMDASNIILIILDTASFVTTLPTTNTNCQQA